MTAKALGLGVVALLGALTYANVSGRHAQRDKDAKHLTDSVSKVVSWRADSVKFAAIVSIDSIAAVSDSIKRAVDARLNVATRNTNAVRQKADSAISTARSTLADSGATIGALRASLTKTVGIVDSLTVAFDRERAANVSARLARDSAFAHERLTLRAGFNATIAAKDEAARAVGLAFSADIKAAASSGKRVGRLQGLTVGIAAVAGIAYLVKR